MREVPRAADARATRRPAACAMGRAGRGGVPAAGARLATLLCAVALAETDAFVETAAYLTPEVGGTAGPCHARGCPVADARPDPAPTAGFDCTLLMAAMSCFALLGPAGSCRERGQDRAFVLPSLAVECFPTAWACGWLREAWAGHAHLQLTRNAPARSEQLQDS